MEFLSNIDADGQVDSVSYIVVVCDLTLLLQGGGMHIFIPLQQVDNKIPRNKNSIPFFGYFSQNLVRKVRKKNKFV